MIKTVKTEKKSYAHFLKVILAITSLTSFCLWLYLRTDIEALNGDLRNYFALSLSITPFIAGLFGFKIAKEWGGKRSLLGKSILFLAAGLILWALGNLIWSYYNIVKQVEAPYPSLADVGYGLGVLFWIVSTIYLGRALGVPLLLRKTPILKWVAAFFAIASIILSYYLFVTLAREGSLGLQTEELLKAFFDLYYPLTDVVSLLIITSVLIVSGRYIGGLLRRPALTILLAMLCSYIYDLTFSYSTTKETYVNGQGSDIFLLGATAGLSFALVMFGTRVVKLRSNPLDE